MAVKTRRPVYLCSSSLFQTERTANSSDTKRKAHQEQQKEQFLTPTLMLNRKQTAVQHVEHCCHFSRARSPLSHLLRAVSTTHCKEHRGNAVRENRVSKSSPSVTGLTKKHLFSVQHPLPNPVSSGCLATDPGENNPSSSLLCDCTHVNRKLRGEQTPTWTTKNVIPEQLKAQRTLCQLVWSRGSLYLNVFSVTTMTTHMFTYYIPCPEQST